MTAPGDTRQGSLTIGAVVEALSPEFPDLSISKVRFLESKGLVKPPRAASGYRRFRTEDVERIRYILTAQRDHFWPLKVIQEALDALDRGLTPVEAPCGTPRPVVPEVPSADEIPSAEELTTPAPRLRLTRRELSQTSGLAEATIDALAGYGLLTPDAQGHFDGSAVPIAKAAAALSSYGIEPRHLRAFRTAADREIGLVEQVVSPLRSRGDTRRDGSERDVAGELLRECLALHAALVRAGLARRG
ncbi:MAG: MerR family transcriptional regulator [Dermatophilus congolensis]|nr:MerR family transcriptional regulator [Dermatophilus congolensis]